jgi:hypothetical protein
VKAALVIAALLATQPVAQQLGSLDAPAPRVKQHVIFVAEPQTIAAGKPAVLSLRFHVDEGFHVNSHTPKSDLQIATAVALNAADGVKLAKPEYPAGVEYALAFDPSDKLDVYSNDFVIKVPLVSTAGEHQLKGELKYQACDKAACYPPRSLPVDVVFKAK